MAGVDRRAVLRLSAIAGVSAALRPSRMFGASGGRTVVCIYLFGGNDSANMFVPMGDYANYASVRGSLAIPEDELLRVADETTKSAYGFHPAMRGVADLFSGGSAAVVANVGRAEARVSKGPEAARMFANLSETDETLDYFPGGYALPGWARDLQATKPAVTGFAGIHGTTGLAGWTAASRNVTFLREFEGFFPATGIGHQLKTVLAAIAGGAGRQAFLVPLSGFNTRSDQTDVYAGLVGELSEAVTGFYRATEALGLAHQVVTYTDTEHGRALAPNKNGGTERGWGGHQLVIGGAVDGGRVYGEMPSMELGGTLDVTGRGVWIPSVLKSEYVGVLGEWLGVSVPQASKGLNFLV